MRGLFAFAEWENTETFLFSSRPNRKSDTMGETMREKRNPGIERFLQKEEKIMQESARFGKKGKCSTAKKPLKVVAANFASSLVVFCRRLQKQKVMRKIEKKTESEKTIKK